MGSARVYETTRDRLIAMFNRKDFTPDQAYYQFRGIYPFNDNVVDYGTIGGCLKYIREYITLDPRYSDIVIGSVVTLNITEKDAHFNDGNIIISCINYNTQYPIIKIMHANPISILCDNIEKDGIANMIKSTLIMKLMSYISTILAKSYKENYFKRW